MDKIVIINGPNLNLLGIRETTIYGTESFESYFNNLHQKFVGITLHYYQSNIEGEIVNAIQKFGLENHQIIINAAAYSHTSVAIADALAAIQVKKVEVHISNIYTRENFRHHSYVSSKVDAVICGMGLYGYEAAINYLIQK